MKFARRKPEHRAEQPPQQRQQERIFAADQHDPAFGVEDIPFSSEKIIEISSSSFGQGGLPRASSTVYVATIGWNFLS